MTGTLKGGLKAKKANLASDPEFYTKLGVLGGKASGGKNGFQTNPKLASAAGRVGGMHTWSHKKDPKYLAKLEKAYLYLLKVQEKAKQEREQE